MADKNILIKILTSASTVGIKAASLGLKGLQATTKALGRGMLKLGGVARKGFTQIRTAALVAAGAIAATVREAYNFTVAMAKVNTMVSGKGILELARQVIKLSGDFGIAKSELAEGLYQALSAGVPKENAIEFLRVASKGAVAGATSVATSVDGLTTVLNAFKIDASKTEQVADVLFTTVKNGKTTFEELASNLAIVAPIAAATNIPIEQIAAAIATMTKQGTPTAVAMTQLRAAIISVNEVLGDGWSNSMSLQEAFAKVATRAKGSQTALRELVGRVEAMNGIMALTGKNAATATQDTDAMTDSAGNLAEAFQKMDIVKTWPKLWQTFLGIVTKVGEQFDKTLKPVVDAITEKLASWRDNQDMFDKLGEKLAEMRDYAVDIFTALTDSAQARDDVVKGLKLGIKGLFLEAAEATVSFLLKAASVIGGLIAEGVKAAMTPGSEGRLRSEAAEQLSGEGKISYNKYAPFESWQGWSDKEKQLVDKRAADLRKREIEKSAAEGKNLIGSATGDDDLQQALALFNRARQTGAKLRGETDTTLDQEPTGNTKLQEKLGKLRDILTGATASAGKEEGEASSALDTYRAELKKPQRKGQREITNQARENYLREQQEAQLAGRKAQAVESEISGAGADMLASVEGIAQVIERIAARLKQIESQVKNSTRDA